MKLYWHACAMKDGRPVFQDGTPVKIGKRYEIDGEPVMCKRGYHGCERAIDMLIYAPGPWISRRPLEGAITEGYKSVGRAFVQQPGFDATEVLRTFARMCALDVIHLWDAPEIVVRYLKTGDESIRDAAWDAARDAARAAGMAAGMAAVKSAAWAAGKDRQNRRLTRMLLEAMRREG